MTDKWADPKRIALHGKDITDQVVPAVRKAGDELGKSGVYDLEGGDFSITCSAAAAAYPIAVQFAFEDLKSELQAIRTLAAQVDRAATTYGDAEAANAGR
ncbi:MULTISPECIES: hypothetical protein [Actinomadura]|uniref:Excreted virulence factor EspC, type VII ESX diderm n=1 Tax=Actinomadura yumaensis TaxID=111807 RepID=A0ABW2CGI0_9ACTN|nr:hypothetical protein [Actinomadura sp. J1-007]MWK34523.1 hypothetical protein [Actinomadura sp. J1-007]